MLFALVANAALRAFRGPVALAFAFAFAFLAAAAAPAQDIVWIEEDWELTLAEPDDVRNAPQITCVMSPDGDLEGKFAAFDLNYRSQPSYSAGGMQVHMWDGDEVDQVKNNNEDGMLSPSGETVTWTQAMRIENGHLIFSVRNGHSSTWGDFGGNGTLRVSGASNSENLNGYDFNLSIHQTHVGFAGNRVSSFVLKRVRWYSAEGLVQEQTGPVSVLNDVPEGD